MWKQIVQGNYLSFKNKTLNVIKGQVPKNIKGRLYRNQAATLAVNQKPIPHWFSGNGSILSLTFNNGNCQANFQHIHTPLYQYIKHNHKQGPGFIESIFRKITSRQLVANGSNTSVYPIPNSHLLLALCEGGLPFILRKDTLESIGFDHFGILKGYSGHPKVDPDTEYIYNIGMGKSPKELYVYKHTSDMQLLKTNNIKLRQYQTIHDCVIAGNYLIFFECPVKFDVKRYIAGSHFLNSVNYSSQTYNNTIVHVFQKQNLKYINKFDTSAFWMFHFINGQQINNQIQIQFIKYNNQQSKQLFNYVATLPEMIFNKKLNQKPWFYNTISKITLNLQNRSIKLEDFPTQYASQFPVISDSEVGKHWRYSYHAVNNWGELNQTKVGIYDRQQRVYSKIFDFGKDSFVSQPVLLQEGDNRYLLPIVYDGHHHKSYAVILDAKDLTQLCVLELPGVIPSSFHGKWDYSSLN